MRGIPDDRWAVLDYKPTKWGLIHVHDREEQFVAAVTSRQIGKTWVAAAEIDDGMSQPRDDIFGPPVVGLLSYDYRRAELSVFRYINMVRAAFGNDYIISNANKHMAYIPSTGAQLIWMSADDLDAGIGFTFSKLVIDESQRVPDAVMDKIYPALSARGASIRAFGTPDVSPTQTWFRAMFMRGQDPDDHKYYSYTATWRDNPWITIEEVDIARRKMSRREFLMLYEGEWVDAEGAVFGKLDAAIIPGFVDFNPTRRTVMSADLAIHDDFTVVFVAEEATGRLIHAERWHQTSPLETYDRIRDIWLRHGEPELVYDATGLGEAMGPELRERGIRRLRPIKFTSASKLPIIGRLQAAIEHGRIRFPEWKPLIDELKAYIYTTTPNGSLGTGSIYGFHDDCVMSLALLNEGLRTKHGSTENNLQSDTYSLSPTERRPSIVRRLAR